jgi:hypothetical protein
LAQAVHIAFLSRIQEGESPLELDELEASTLERLLEVFRMGPNAWHCLKQARLDQATLTKLLIEIPMAEMAKIAKDHHIRLVYVFVPNTHPNRAERRVHLALQEFLRQIEVEYVDLFEDMAEEKGERRDRQKSQKPSGVMALYAELGLRAKLADLSLGWLDPVPAIGHLKRFNEFRNRHTRSKYIDDIGHPSELGNEIIARRLFDFLEPSR